MTLFKMNNRGDGGVGGYFIGFPLDTGVPAVSKGLADLQAAVERLKALQATVQPSADAVAAAKAHRAGQAKLDGRGKSADLAGAIARVKEAKGDVEILDAQLEGARGRQAELTTLFRALVLTNEKDLRAAAKPRAAAARDKIVSATRLLADAEAELAESAGVIEMFEHGDEYRHVVRAHAGAIPLNAAIQGTGDAVRALGARERALG